MLTLTKHAYGLQSVHAVNDNAHSWLQTTAITAHVKSNELGSTRAEFHKPHGIPHPTFSTRITLSRKSTEFMLAGFHLSISKQRPQTYGWFEHNTITTTVGLYFGKLHRTQWNKTEIKTTTKTHKTRRGNGTAATSTFNSTVSQLASCVSRSTSSCNCTMLLSGWKTDSCRSYHSGLTIWCSQSTLPKRESFDAYC